MIVIAHRGASGERPENTLSAFQLAVDQGADMIETDLHLTRDGTIALVHDPDLPGRGDVGTRTMADLRELDVGDGETIPTLGEALDRFGSQIAFNLELKQGVRGRYPGLTQQALREVERRGLLEKTLFSSFEPQTLAEIRSLALRARIGVLQAEAVADPISKATSFRAEAVHPSGKAVSDKLVHSCHNAGYKVYVYTVDEPAEMIRLNEMGVDGIFTNYPARLREVLAGAEASA